MFDCAATYGNISINQAVHQGPDLTNKLIGVLLRFREKPIAMIADVQAMYHQVRVTPAHRDVLRFLWFDGDKIATYRMCVHLFGGIWSASVASYALKRTAHDHSHMFDSGVVDAVINNFYVDDLLQSVDSDDEAVEMADQLRRLLSLRGFNLTKWTSNSRRLIQSIPEEHRAKEIQKIDIDYGDLPRERALGVSWMIQEDVLALSIGMKQPVMTKRGLISMYSSVYDPLGIVAPYVLIARILYRQECSLDKHWDDALEPVTIRKFERWLDQLEGMKEVSVPRCVAAPDMTDVAAIQLHFFCDASEEAYAAVCYVRIALNDGTVHCSFLFGKSRLAPLQTRSIPRLELMAAVLAVEIYLMIKIEIRMPVDGVFFWSDSTCVLYCIRNKALRLKSFTARRIANIHQVTDPEQWFHVPTDLNPADCATRGTNKLSEWLDGPAFMREGDVDFLCRCRGIRCFR